MNDFVRPLFFAAFVCGALFILFAAGLSWYGSWLDSRESRAWAISDGVCNIAVVPIQGEIVAYEGDSMYTEGDASSASMSTSGDWVEGYVSDAENDPAIVGIVAQIDSYGGYVSPGHQMMSSLRDSSLPTVAYIREVGISSGYMAALGADHIVAAPFAAVGSIGITYSYIENSAQNEQEGRRFVQLSSGEFKDTGNPNKPLTPAEKELYERDLDIYENMFVDLVAVARQIPREEVAKLADGSSLPASLALEHGLIDEVGDYTTVGEWFADTLGVPPENIVFCK